MAARPGTSPSSRAGRAAAVPASRPRKPRDSLNRSVIVEAAIRVVERDGLEGLTFHALGKELNAHATSMYRHFRDKDELLLEVIDSLRERSYGDALVSTGDWREDIRLQASHIRQHYLRYGPFAHQMSVRSTHRKIEYSNLEFTLGALHRAGLTRDEAVLYTRLLGNYIRSMASFEASVQQLEPDLRAKDRVQTQLDAMSLDREQFPYVAESATSLLALDDPRVFGVGLEAILDTIERLGEDRPA